jgi:hypothetical protein
MDEAGVLEALGMDTVRVAEMLKRNESIVMGSISVGSLLCDQTAKPRLR